MEKSLAPAAVEPEAVDGAVAPRPRRARPRQVTFPIPDDLRIRLNATFMATRVQEDEASFSEMMCKLIEREVERRETVYNQGRRFATWNSDLPTGRPLSRS